MFIMQVYHYHKTSATSFLFMVHRPQVFYQSQLSLESDCEVENAIRLVECLPSLLKDLGLSSWT